MPLYNFILQGISEKHNCFLEFKNQTLKGTSASSSCANPRFTFCSLQFAVCSLQFAVCSLQFAVCSLLVKAIESEASCFNWCYCLMEAENGDTKSKMEDYEVMEQIGKGAFGAAFLVLHKIENKKYVLKKIRLSKPPDKFKGAALQEMNLMAKLNHPYIVEYKDAWLDKGSCMCIVTNYCEGGDIYEIIRKAKGAYFPEEKVCKWLTQMLLAIDYLHSNRVLHRDLKLSNVFITKENDLRLGDFGWSKLLDEEGLTSSAVGTPNYMCPELLADIPYGYKSDIWSLGCCVFEIAAHQQAFRAPDMAGLINKINRSLISPLPIVYSSALKQIIKSMLRKSPEHRPTAAELLRHPHLQPFLLRCHNPSTVFLPVKSPSSNNSKEKIGRPSPRNSGGMKDLREREVKLKQRELLPLFEENTDLQHPNLLDGVAFIEDKLETKRVDPTSYSGKISHDSEDSKSGDTSCETTACNGDDQDNFDSSSSLKEIINSMDTSKLPSNALSEHEDSLTHAAELKDTNLETKKSMDVEPISSPLITAETETNDKDTTLEKCSKMTSPDTVCSDQGVSLLEGNMSWTEETVRSEVDAEPRSSLNVELSTGSCSGVPLDGMPTENAETRPNMDVVKINEHTQSEPTQIQKEDAPLTNQAPIDNLLLNTSAAISIYESNRVWENPGLHRADALESLLELCARLLKQDKFDELSGVLKPFGEDVVSSRETAIWLTKSLMNAQKFPKES